MAAVRSLQPLLPLRHSGLAPLASKKSSMDRKKNSETAAAATAVTEDSKTVATKADRNVMMLFVRASYGGIWMVSAFDDWTVLDLKRQLQNHVGCCPRQQRLIFCSRELLNDATLRSYNIRDEFTLHLVLRLMGS